MSVYIWGSNKSQQLPGQNGLHAYAPTLVSDQFEGQTPVQVAAGDGHTLVLFESGDIYSCGRGREGQLGREISDFERKKGSVATKTVLGLEHESIVGIAAGALTSYAISAAGEVYQWGLVHQHVNQNASFGDSMDANATAAAGGLTGIAQDQDTTVVHVDNETRASHRTPISASSLRNNNNGNNNNSSRHTAPPESRLLRDIVRDSTERWMMPTEDAELEYYEELRSMGYQNEEVEQRMQNRGREYHGMLAMGCKRAIQPVPRLIPNLDGIRIVSVSAGYAHVMLLSDKGQLYAAGYNDRGQLGLGHRINTSDFKHVDFLANKFVLQVVCGQQHTLCRAVDVTPAASSPGGINSSSSSSNSSSDQQQPSPVLSYDPSTVFVGSTIGADAYVWGNGILGQLGLGLRGTGKGRLLPTLLTHIHDLYPSGVIDVAAGANFSALVTTDGSVYSFGHAEYNQHGTGNQSYHDYTDPYHYFIPRVIECFDNREDQGKLGVEAKKKTVMSAIAAATGQRNSVRGVDKKIRMRSLTCGAVFTVGVDESGNLHSWGWNESGVLGHGFNHFGSSPSQITTIGKGFDGCKVANLAAGVKHVVALTQAQGNPWALTFRSILDTAPYADCVLQVSSGSGSGSGGGSSSVQFPCHRAILACRSQYFAGFIRAAERAVEEDRLYAQLSAATSGMSISGVSDMTSGQDQQQQQLLRLSLVSPYANASTIKSLLEYVYLDRVHIPLHRRKELLNLACDLNISSLITALECDLVSGAAAGLVNSAASVTDTSSSSSSSSLGEVAKVDKNAAVNATVSASSFHNDMCRLFASSQQQRSQQQQTQQTESQWAWSGVNHQADQHWDIVFVDSPVTVPRPTFDSYDGDDNNNGENDPTHGKSVVFDPSKHSFVLYAHRVIISRIAYFDAIVAGHFSESSNYVSVEDTRPDSGTTTKSGSGLVGGQKPTRRVLCVDVSGLLADGIDLETFHAVIVYAYTGRFTLPANILSEGSDNSNPFEDSEDSADMALVMSCLVAANRLGFTLLTQHCERVLSLHLGEFYPHNAENALAFAVNYNIPRLERQCLKVLKRSHEITVSSSGGGDSGSSGGGGGGGGGAAAVL